MLEWSRTTSEGYGIAQDRALAYASTLGGILKTSSLTREEAARLGTQFVQLGGDMASFNNASPADTLEAIRAGLVGEYEPLRRYQVLLSEARVSQEALTISGKASKQELTEREKVLARVNLILRGTTDQQGDAARTSREYAAQVRQLNARVRDLQASTGTLLLPVLTETVILLNEGTSAANTFAGALGRLGSISIPGTSTGLGAILKEIVTRTGPQGSYRNLLDLIALIRGDDVGNAAGDRAPHGRGGSLRGPALRAQEEAAERRRNRRTMADILLDQARASTTPDDADDLRFHREAEQRLRRQIGALERRKNLTAKQKETLTQLYAQLSREQAAIFSIIDRRESEQAAREEQAARRREEERRRRQAALDRIMEAAERTAEARGELLAGTGGSRQNMRRQALRHVDAVTKALQEKQQASAAAFDPVAFLTSLRGTMNQFGGNLFASGSLQVAGGAPNPELFRLVSESMETNRLLSGLVSSTRHPGTRNARTELALAFDGPTF